MSPTALMNLFARSPIHPLQEHMQKVQACAKMLVPFIEAAAKQDWSTADQIQKKISQAEHEADELKKDLRLHLPNSLFLPVARTDILEVLRVQDGIANCTEDISGIMLGRKIIIPEQISDQFMRLVERVTDASEQACKAICELDELLETGFRGNEVKVVEKMIVKLDQIEGDTDNIQREIHNTLFTIEDQYPPIDMIFLYKTIDKIGKLADRAQKVGGRLQLLLAR